MRRTKPVCRLLAAVMACGWMLGMMTACGQTPVPAEQPTATPAPTAVPAPPPLPWAGEPAQEALDYETYFGEIRDYHTAALTYSWELPEEEEPSHIDMDLPDGYRYRNGELMLLGMENSLAGVKVIWQYPVELGGDFVPVTCDHQYVYGIQNGRDLIRTDYTGENKQLLFTDTAGVWQKKIIAMADPLFPGEIYRQMQMPFYLADRCCLFFLAGSSRGDGLSVYRIYLPSSTVDELIGGLPLDAFLYKPVSNQEILWSVPNPEYLESFEKIRNYPDDPFMPELDDEAALLEFDAIYHVPPHMDHYYHAGTGVHSTAQGCRDWPYVARSASPQEMQINGPCWWLDGSAKPAG